MARWVRRKAGRAKGRLWRRRKVGRQKLGGLADGLVGAGRVVTDILDLLEGLGMSGGFAGRRRLG